ncbi:transglutaminase-like cysteine peptidase [Hansschlegelia beijingensis]|uniref:transglutaminase-like cysteine peptidase n=1 Tax=Hansschlegelia beijingensis TaxID=1133344 RepID=UPI00381995BA
MLLRGKFKSIYFLFGLVAGGFTITGAQAAPSIKLALTTPMQVEGSAKSPIGWIDFCKTHSADCDVKAARPVRAQLTEARFKELDAINRKVNAAIAPMTDQELYGVEEKWTYPADKGDCEDYVLLKRRMLMDAGWPRQALLITVVRDLKGDGHAVLTVVTDRGDYTLDNQADDVKPWFETGYTYIKRQSQIDPNVWVLLGDGIGPVGVATAP